MKKISNLQLFILVVNFLLGSAILFPLGIKAKQDSYLVMVFALPLGIILAMIYIKINSIDPQKNLIEINKEIFGRYLGWLVGMIYSSFFLYISIRNIRDFAGQLNHFLVTQASLKSLTLLAIILIIYCIYYNIEMIARVTTFTLVIGLLLLTPSTIYLLFFSADLTTLQPVLAKGLTPIWKEIYPGILAFPLAELIIFPMVFSKVNNYKNIKRYFIRAISLSFLILTINTVTIVSVLGITLAENVSYPLVRSGQIVSGNLLKLDFFIALSTTLILFEKIKLLMYGAVKGFSILFNLSYKRLSIILPIIAGYLSIIIAPGRVQHLEFGLGPSLWINIGIGIYLPIISLLVYYLKRLFVKNKKSDDG
ncbi:spore germination protein KB [Orenia metallireducens]|uniref:GerAB/ArcD/ProY family transporter n=1 Tax=Orenia metallireducens TaxID=1413210 RepID=UPI000D056370|nr:endospore germination permease [Orenia metallireducens]PRX31703.1 spore germination protein KB [Orenia metallireducens]